MNFILAILMQASIAMAAIPLVEVTSSTPATGVRQQVNFYTQQLEEDLKRAQNNTERFQALNKASDQIRVLKENALTQTASDEGYMELVLAVLDSVPRGKSFHRGDCDKYENDLLNQYEPLAEDEPEEPGVKPGWNALQAICK